MQEAYFKHTYITPMAISNTISSHILNLSDKIKSYAKSSSVGLEIAPGSCDLVKALVPHFKFFIPLTLLLLRKIYLQMKKM
ncbi:hypothetical protein [Campylobacter helveticus]|uniref:hypothetical protein n=1 Tax=Campylobacter helveticus TaxID=28898 RepID=UPI001044A788|nr:hypothetical protein [Campylobacter helveticus]QBL11980.1 hypothetical protein A0073_05835 [Campylobacter helveticus]